MSILTEQLTVYMYRDCAAASHPHPWRKQMFDWKTLACFAQSLICGAKSTTYKKLWYAAKCCENMSKHKYARQMLESADFLCAH